jgi:hypothetical protein
MKRQPHMQLVHCSPVAIPGTIHQAVGANAGLVCCWQAAHNTQHSKGRLGHVVWRPTSVCRQELWEVE